MALPSTAILDNFDRSDSSPLNGSWEFPAINAVVGLPNLVGNRVECVANEFSAGLWTGDTFGPGSEARFTIGVPPESAGDPTIAGLTLLCNMKYVEAESEWRANAAVIYQESGIGVVGLGGFFIGSGSYGYGFDASFSTGSPLAVGDEFCLQVLDGSKYVYYKPFGGSWLLLGSDASVYQPDAGQIGISLLGIGYTGELDEFNDPIEAPVSLDNFGGGTIVASAPPDAPTLLTAVAASNTQIDLAWTDNSDNEDGFEIERSADGLTGWALIDTTAANVTTRTNTSLSAGTTYYYRVRAFNADGYSAYSNIASATTMAIPNPPTLLIATAVSASSIELDWTDNATNETGYKIERGLDGVNFSQIDVVGPNTDEYTDTDLLANTLYYYRVRAYNADGNSAYSNIASATTRTRCEGGFAYFDVLLRTARLLENLNEGTATADGTTTTLVDSHLGTFSGGADDNYNGGSVFWKTHKDRPISGEVVGAVANASTFAGTLAVPPAVAGTVDLVTPNGNVTDDGAGAFTSAVVTETEEAIDFTFVGGAGTASAQLTYLRPEAGTVIARYDTAAEGHPSDTDDGAGAIDVWIPITQYATLASVGEVVAARTATGSYPADELPVTPGTVTLQTPSGNVTDDGSNVFESVDVVLTGEPIAWSVPTITPSTAYVVLLDSGLADTIGNITPGSLTITWDNGVDTAVTNTDDGAGNIDVYIGDAGGVPAGNHAGTIDYVTGRVMLTGLPFDKAALLVAETADYLFDVTYKAVTGTIDYGTGAIALVFAAYVTGTIYIISLISEPHFVPATVSYTTGLISLTGLTPGDGAFLHSSADYKITYGHRPVTGTVNVTTGAIALNFDRLVTGNVTASYTQNTGRVFLPVIMRATDFVAATGTVTFEPTGLFNLATGQGDTYGIAPRRYPYYLMFQKLNQTLTEIKSYLLDQTDILVSAIVNNEVTLDDTVRIFKILNGNTTQAPQDWRTIERYRHQNGRLRFYDRLFQDTIRIKYFADVPEVTSETDCLPRQIDATWLALETAINCVRWRLMQPGADEKMLTVQVNDLMARAAKQRARLNLYTPEKSAMKLAMIPDR